MYFPQSILNSGRCSAKNSIGSPRGVTNFIVAFYPSRPLPCGRITNKNSRDSIEPSALSGISITISLTPYDSRPVFWYSRRN